jgi:peptidoglycan/LPS O-acetylase OafA/YrhL
LLAWRERVPWRAVTGLLVAAVIVVTAIAPSLLSVDNATMVGVIVVGLATMAAMISMSIDQLGDRPVTASHRRLASPMLRRLGAFSFSLYLVHYPLIALVSLGWLDRFQLTVPATFAVLVAVCVPLCLACAYVFHLVVERRYINSPTPVADSALPARALSMA